MKKMAEIMDDLGFRPDGSDDVKKAFVKNLIKQASQSEFKKSYSKRQKDNSDKNQDPDEFQQISLFDQKLSS